MSCTVEIAITFISLLKYKDHKTMFNLNKEQMFIARFCKKLYVLVSCIIDNNELTCFAELI